MLKIGSVGHAHPKRNQRPHIAKNRIFNLLFHLTDKLIGHR